jgi:Na+/H+ antiporter NhaD/arsenite permease-like protein
VDEDYPIVAVAPFVVTLLCIAILPLATPHWWEHNRNKAIVIAAIAAPMAAWLGLAHAQALVHSLHEYASFLMLLAALFVVSGGIFLEGDLEAKPGTNVAILAVGAVLANVVGTTGASMVLIRLILRTNRQRERVAHLPFFFILIVSNCGGLLTPLGDPPLFLGYLRGVPFEWTATLWPVWIMSVGYLLAACWIVDRREYAQETALVRERDIEEKLPLRVRGWIHVPLLGCVVAAVFLPTPWRELAMGAVATVSYLVGKPALREQNGFSFGPIVEVAVLFAGIFVTMVPALELLRAHGADLGLTSPWHFFLTTGGLSSVLDNAPTYLTLLSAAQSLPLAEEVVGIPDVYLAAISTGAVLMGANTYIGNGPNFMVKAIADSSGYRTPSFFRYAAAALVTLLPVYVMVLAYLTWVR